MKARFLLSTLTEFPNLKTPKGKPLPEIAIAGRSNVGKSSLINHLFNQKNLARASATPGKTRLLNFFLIDESFILVDLPGYGFANAPLEEIQEWSKAIDAYLTQRASLKLLLLLVDSRRDFSQEDRTLLEWASMKNIPLLLIFTKTDKLSHPEKEALLKKYPEAHFHSITNPKLSHLLKKRIEAILWA